ncbi:hypothetical protein L5515_016617 [Caenorhabditis briggsae]|uniref:Uncharacterized protein n=1 Tax=Caenorhabditis briggsae TaxID=6238 RepID=A0AAE9FB70_CAEBR|nr:hypothetical protein L5515_016617 [Caenorhabditis briggsae]
MLLSRGNREGCKSSSSPATAVTEESQEAHTPFQQQWGGASVRRLRVGRLRACTTAATSSTSNIDATITRRTQYQDRQDP